jgi:trans-2,3-dihydro-3-hydroxyanthranilate isomerase
MTSVSTRAYRFVQVDVFTDRVFGGNPLAVLLDARGLDDSLMQQIAREMNLSETVFLFPPTRPDCVAALRIFTPAREVPFAEHPTIGTAWVLAAHGMAPAASARFVLEEKIESVPVELEGDPAHPNFIWMKQQDATFDPALQNREAVARALGLTLVDLWPDAPIQPGSTGNKFLFVPLRDKATVDRAVLDVRAMLEAMGERPRMGIFRSRSRRLGGARLLAHVRPPLLGHSGGPGDGLGQRPARRLPGAEWHGEGLR